MLLDNNKSIFCRPSPKSSFFKAKEDFKSDLGEKEDMLDSLELTYLLSEFPSLGCTVETYS